MCLHNEYQWFDDLKPYECPLFLKKWRKISGALLQSVTFISRLMHSVTQNVDVKIYIVYKFKRDIIKNYSNMFRITKSPSSGSDDLHFDWNYF